MSEKEAKKEKVRARRAQAVEAGDVELIKLADAALAGNSFAMDGMISRIESEEEAKPE